MVLCLGELGNWGWDPTSPPWLTKTGIAEGRNGSSRLQLFWFSRKPLSVGEDSWGHLTAHGLRTPANKTRSTAGNPWGWRAGRSWKDAGWLLDSWTAPAQPRQELTLKSFHAQVNPISKKQVPKPRAFPSFVSASATPRALPARLPATQQPASAAATTETTPATRLLSLPTSCRIFVHLAICPLVGA